ncbi:unnamed protein product, partial [Brassica rapa subsp. trilocularis]
CKVRSKLACRRVEGAIQRFLGKTKKKRPSKHPLDDVEGLELREDSRWARGFAVRIMLEVVIG